MSDHLSSITVTALADGELMGEDLARVNAHLAQCDVCTRRALGESLLHRATARAGQKYALPPGFQERVIGSLSASHIHQSEQAAETRAPLLKDNRAAHSASGSGSRYAFASYRWLGAIAATALVCVSVFVMRNGNAAQTALVNEAVDEHIAAMAAGAPEVISTDRHTVKPWFQGKLPFSFNLPQALPPDTTLDGANLVQVEGRPAAQLLFSIGKHHASVFVWQRSGTAPRDAERNGFHVEGFRSRELDAIAVSDADPVRLRDLVQAMATAQQ
jgi:anti-sigma factor RsiW